jgi:hypothetical protein
MSEATPAIQAVPLADLRAEYVRQSKIRIAAVADSNVILAEIQRRYAKNLFDNAIKAKGKEHGEGTDIIDGIKVRVGVKQTVSWDTEKLKTVYATLPGDVAEKVFKLTLGVPEKIFNALTDKELIDKLTDARTTKLSPPMVEFVFEEGEIK